MVCGDLPEGLQGGVRLQRLGDVLGALSTDAVVPDTASESQKDTLGGADSRETMRGDVLERGEGLVRLKTLRNVLGALSTNAIGTHTASESHRETSRGADSRKMMRGSVLELGDATRGRNNPW